MRMKSLPSLKKKPEDIIVMSLNEVSRTRLDTY